MSSTYFWHWIKAPLFISFPSHKVHFSDFLKKYLITGSGKQAKFHIICRNLLKFHWPSSVRRWFLSMANVFFTFSPLFSLFDMIVCFSLQIEDIFKIYLR